MKKLDTNKIFYYLSFEDIQNVANQEIERNLTDAEIEKILDAIAERINWYDAIADTINETFKENSNEALTDFDF